MNSSYNFSVSSSLSNRDTSTSAAVKNVIVLALGLFINYINGMLILTFRKHQVCIRLIVSEYVQFNNQNNKQKITLFQVFYMNPRYILFIHLVVNDMIQLTSAVSLFVISYVFYKINASLCCFILVFALFTTQNTPLNLAVMAVECYIAVCFPLRHAELCTVRRTYILIVWIWVLGVLSIMPDVFLTLATESKWLFSSSILCDRDTLFQHPVSIQKRDVSYVVYLTGVWLTLLFTYCKIFFVARAAHSADGKAKKARNTILLHGFQLLLCMLTYVYPMFKNASVYLFPTHHVHIIFVWYILIQILSRFVSPIVYGLQDTVFKQHLRKYLFCGMKTGKKSYCSWQNSCFPKFELR